MIRGAEFRPTCCLGFSNRFTTKEVGKGIGLGLAIVHGIVQEHGGEIIAANHPDGGALFRIAVPVPQPGLYLLTLSLPNGPTRAGDELWMEGSRTQERN